MITDKAPYYILPADVEARVGEALTMAVAMAKDKYPHLVSGLEFARKRYREEVEVFIGKENKPQAKKAYKK